MEDLKSKTKECSDLECDIYDIRNAQDFSVWLEKALNLTESFWGKGSIQYTCVRGFKNHYIILSLLNSFDLEQAQKDALEIIEVCNEALV